MEGDVRRKERLKPVYINGRLPTPPEPDVRKIVDAVMDVERNTLKIKKEVTRYGKPE
jgi:ribosomal protein S24E